MNKQNETSQQKQWNDPIKAIASLKRFKASKKKFRSDLPRQKRTKENAKDAPHNNVLQSAAPEKKGNENCNQE